MLQLDLQPANVHLGASTLQQDICMPSLEGQQLDFAGLLPSQSLVVGLLSLSAQPFQLFDLLHRSRPAVSFACCPGQEQ